MSPNQPRRRRLAPPQECQDLDLNGLHRLMYLNTGFLAGGAEMAELWGGEIYLEEVGLEVGGGTLIAPS